MYSISHKMKKYHLWLPFKLLSDIGNRVVIIENSANLLFRMKKKVKVIVAVTVISYKA